jgi:hypothetical protein
VKKKMKKAPQQQQQRGVFDRAENARPKKKNIKKRAEEKKDGELNAENEQKKKRAKRAPHTHTKTE